MSKHPLPIDNILPDLLAVFEDNLCVVLSADPGAGKTTRVPVAILDTEWLQGEKIILLEPRRLAAVRSAQYMASSLGKRIGETVGFRIRGETKVSSKTRIEVVTEGILTRMLQNDPDLPGVGLIIFDEFHERSIHADLGLALALDVQSFLRKDLRILIMSATLDGLTITKLISGAKILKSEGRTHPVKKIYLAHTYKSPIERLVASTVIRALEKENGDLLVFLPGAREIRRVKTILEDSKLSEYVFVHTLYGDAPPQQQQAALTPASPGTRKVILSTSLAETSLTIDGVRVVIDSGLARSPRFDPRRGMSGLVTTQVSLASADQRCGRAGRQSPGVCYRLWTEARHKTLAKFSTPEILATDLAPLALDLARWESPGGENLRFIDPPPSAHLAQATTLLTQLGALDWAGKLTSHGREMSELGVHPRLAHMLIRGKELGLSSLACDVAALLEEHSLLRGKYFGDIDLHSRWHDVYQNGSRDQYAQQKVFAQATRLREMLGVDDTINDEEKIGLLLALAYPERIGKLKNGKHQLVGGPVAVLPKGSLLSNEEYLAIGDADGV